MIKIVRFNDSNLGLRMGLLDNDKIYDITEVTENKITDVKALYELADGHIVTFISMKVIPLLDKERYYSYNDLDIPAGCGKRYLLKAVDAPEVWAAGVTYERSKDARELETQLKNVYDRVYDAVRPEIFFKASPSRHVGPYECVGIRSDSKWNVPEPELGLVLSSDGKIIGYIIGNDMSSRDIEGENPLYLPQAKVYKNCCGLGPVLALHQDGYEANSLTIQCRIKRDGKTVYDDKTTTSKLKRTFNELIEYLTRDNFIPESTVLLTGTCLVPDEDFTLRDGDEVEISIDGLGTLKNIVKQF